jgi:hypothetical protein
MHIIIPVQCLQTCVLEPDDGSIRLKHVVRKKTTNCECVKVTDKYQQESTQHTGMLHYRLEVLLYYKTGKTMSRAEAII